MNDLLCLRLSFIELFSADALHTGRKRPTSQNGIYIFPAIFLLNIFLADRHVPWTFSSGVSWGEGVQNDKTRSLRIHRGGSTSGSVIGGRTVLWTLKSVVVGRHSSPFITIHHHCSPFITIHHHSLPFITIHYHSSPFITIHYHTSPFITIHHHSFPLIHVHLAVLLFAVG